MMLSASCDVSTKCHMTKKVMLHHISITWDVNECLWFH